MFKYSRRITYQIFRQINLINYMFTITVKSMFSDSC